MRNRLRKSGMISKNGVSLSSVAIRRPGKRTETINKFAISEDKWINVHYPRATPASIDLMKRRPKRMGFVSELNLRRSERESPRCISIARIAASLD